MTCRSNSATFENAHSDQSWRHPKILLFIILLLAAFLRLFNLGQSPPGLNQDEAANAWSAYCLLKTGKDYTGASWPIYYMRNLGGNRPTLYIYLLLPFQAIGGLNIYTTRLPGALSGILAVWLIYFVGKRLFSIRTGMVAAALLAIDPLHIQQSRWGHEVTLAPLLGLAPLALMLWAGLPVSDDKTSSQRPVIAAFAGTLSGLGCFGYMSVRLFVPVFIFAIVLFTLPDWWKTIKTRKGALATALFYLGFAITWGALIWQHIFHPEGIGRHALFQGDWVGSVPFAIALKNMALRYIQHFNPSFLFINHDPNPLFSPPTIGYFYWYMAPLMLAGLVWLLWRFKSISARVLIAFLLAYLVGDCLFWGGGLNIMRSAPGLCALILLSAVGAVGTVRWLWAKNHIITIVAAVVFSVPVIGMNIKYLHYFYGKFSREQYVYINFHTDFVEACEWLRPRFADFDAVFCAAVELNMPYVVSTVVLGYDPKLWFNEPRNFTTIGEWDRYTRYGKMNFLYDYTQFSFEDISKRFAPGRVLLIVRPDEYKLLIELEKIKRPD
jgi:4-amino-4-deoxy-L-arabinose transferase-like glycosyltransferase